MYTLSEKYTDFDYHTAEVKGDDIFDTSTLGGFSGIADCIPGSKDCEYMKKVKNKVGEIKNISPNEYFKICAERFGTTKKDLIKQRSYSEDYLKELEEVITVKKKKFPMTFIDLTSPGSQEGLHRMLVAARLFGWDHKFPVLFVDWADKERHEREVKEEEDWELEKHIREAIKDTLWYEFNDLEEFKLELSDKLRKEIHGQWNSEAPEVDFKLILDGENSSVTINDVSVNFDQNDIKLPEESYAESLTEDQHVYDVILCDKDFKVVDGRRWFQKYTFSEVEEALDTIYHIIRNYTKDLLDKNVSIIRLTDNHRPGMIFEYVGGDANYGWKVGQDDLFSDVASRETNLGESYAVDYTSGSHRDLPFPKYADDIDTAYFDNEEEAFKFALEKIKDTEDVYGWNSVEIYEIDPMEDIDETIITAHSYDELNDYITGNGILSKNINLGESKDDSWISAPVFEDSDFGEGEDANSLRIWWEEQMMDISNTEDKVEKASKAESLLDYIDDIKVYYVKDEVKETLEKLLDEGQSNLGENLKFTYPYVIEADLKDFFDNEDKKYWVNNFKRNEFLDWINEKIYYEDEAVDAEEYADEVSNYIDKLRDQFEKDTNLGENLLTENKNYPDIVQGRLWRKNDNSGYYKHPLVVRFGKKQSAEYPFSAKIVSDLATKAGDKLAFLSEEDARNWPAGNNPFLSTKITTYVRIDNNGSIPCYVEYSYAEKNKDRLDKTILDRLNSKENPAAINIDSNDLNTLLDNSNKLKEYILNNFNWTSIEKYSESEYALTDEKPIEGTSLKNHNNFYLFINNKSIRLESHAIEIMFEQEIINKFLNIVLKNFDTGEEYYDSSFYKELVTVRDNSNVGPDLFPNVASWAGGFDREPVKSTGYLGELGIRVWDSIKIDLTKNLDQNKEKINNFISSESEVTKKLVEIADDYYRVIDKYADYSYKVNLGEKLDGTTYDKKLDAWLDAHWDEYHVSNWLNSRDKDFCRIILFKKHYGPMLVRDLEKEGYKANISTENPFWVDVNLIANETNLGEDFGRIDYITKEDLKPLNDYITKNYPGAEMNYGSDMHKEHSFVYIAFSEKDFNIYNEGFREEIKRILNRFGFISVYEQTVEDRDIYDDWLVYIDKKVREENLGESYQYESKFDVQKVMDYIEDRFWDSKDPLNNPASAVTEYTLIDDVIKKFHLDPNDIALYNALEEYVFDEKTDKLRKYDIDIDSGSDINLGEMLN